MVRRSENFTAHLEELRRRLIVSAAALTIGTGVAFAGSDRIVALLLEPARAAGAEVYFFAPAEAFFLRLNAAFAAGFALASPVVIAQGWLFVAPGLTEREKKAALPLAAVSVTLFLAGAAFAYAAVLPAGFRFLLGFATETLRPHLSASQCVSFAVGTVLSFGVAFNVPLVLAGLCYFGLVDSASLGRRRRHAAVCVFIAAAVLTPSPDVASQVMLGVPLLALYETGVFAARIAERLRRANTSPMNAASNTR